MPGPRRRSPRLRIVFFLLLVLGGSPAQGSCAQDADNDTQSPDMNYFPDPSAGPWHFQLPPRVSITRGSALAFFKANFHPDPFNVSVVWAIIGQVATTRSGYIAHWGILERSWWSRGPDVSELDSCRASHLWLQPASLGNWTDQLSRGGTNVTFTINTLTEASGADVVFAITSIAEPIAVPASLSGAFLFLYFVIRRR